MLDFSVFYEKIKRSTSSADRVNLGVHDILGVRQVHQLPGFRSCIHGHAFFLRGGGWGGSDVLYYIFSRAARHKLSDMSAPNRSTLSRPAPIGYNYFVMGYNLLILII